MSTFDSAKKRFDGFERQYARYYQCRQISFFLFGLASVLGYAGLCFHTPIALVLGVLIYGVGLFLFVKAEKLLNSVLNALLLEQPPVRMSIQENIEYLQLKTTLVNKLT